MSEILQESVAGALYGLVGIAVLGLGYLMVELVTPGRLGRLIWVDRNRGAAVVLSTALIAVAAIVSTAILSSESGLGAGLASTFVYGVVGLVMMSAVFGIIGVMTPGKLGETVLDDKDGKAHPAAWTVGATYIAVAAVVAAAIS